MTATEDAVREALRQVLDPELGVNIVDLGLVYEVHVDAHDVRIVMTMTSPACPLGDYIKQLIESEIASRLPDVERTDIEFVFEPRWQPEMMSDAAKRHLDGG